ncbi:NIF3-like protein 1 [Cimex lectularius]|uniref:NIF3-like protein 1 n=1 Tax=Cimex lectularius TaxID=79782 RepID=A0A8I6TLJ5_CIMLE|nr:NIF3-like protein 1 [Cimex lectularius]XP_014262245.1 NIF3-like protein 1 [Cimex lectularius]XP_014262246.1 NIF3-like protein 1 [Cimex lectularius]
MAWIRKLSRAQVNFSKHRSFQFYSYTAKEAMSGDRMGVLLSDVVMELDRFANPQMAEPWDNVGLLIEPATPTSIKNVLLTNDLTEDVMEEALGKNTNLIISYHPPIFSALKRITNTHWKQRIVSKCLENRVAVYSPHTAWDAVHGGVTDWLTTAFRGYYDESTVQPIVNPVDTSMDGNFGMGRIIKVHSITLNDSVALLKKHTRLDHLRIALAKGKTLSSEVSEIALVPGSGGSLLKGVKADLHITGEMFHHDLLELNHDGVSVILTNHSDSERGFLKKMEDKLNMLFEGKINIETSVKDKDPIVSV